MTVMDYPAVGKSFVAVRRISQGLDRGNTSHSSSALVVAGSATWLGKGLSCVCVCAKRRDSDSHLSFDLTPAELALTPEAWFNEFNTARKHHGPINDQCVDELSMLNVQDWGNEFGDQTGKAILGDNAAYNWAEAYFKYLNEEATAKQQSEASRGVYAFSDLNKYVGRQQLFSGALVSLEAEVLKDLDNAEDWRLPGIATAQNDDDQRGIVSMMHVQEVDPTNLEFLLALGVSHTNELGQQAASKYLYSWLSQHPKYSTIGPPELSDSLYYADEVCRQRLQSRIDVPYDTSLLEYQEALWALWETAFPEKELHDLVSEQWKEMGWQGTDPSTDLRCRGYKSLENYLDFSRKFSKLLLVLLPKQEGDRAMWEYPFAVAGVNITFMLIQMLDLEAAEVVVGSAAWLGKGLSCLFGQIRDSDSRLPFYLTPSEMVASKYIGYATSNGVGGVYNTHTGKIRERDVVHSWRSIADKLAHAPEAGFSEFSTACEHHGPVNDQLVEEFSKLNVQDWEDEFGDRMGKATLGDNSADNWAEAYVEYLNEEAIARQRSEASRGVYLFSDFIPYVRHPNHMKGQEQFRKRLEADLLKNPDNAKVWSLLGISNAEIDDDQQTIAYMMHAQEVNPTNLEVLLALGLSHTNELEKPAALKYLYCWLSHHPKCTTIVPPELSESRSYADVCIQRLQSCIEVPCECATSLPEHQEALRALRDAAFPEKDLHNLVFEQWKEKGWQGKDFSTDLRCGRYTVLENLLCFVRNIPKSFLVFLPKQEGDGAMREYPFAVAVVNITSALIQILDLVAEVVVGFAAWLRKGLSCVCAPIRDSDSHLPFDLTPAEMAASKYVAYATSDGLVGVYNTHTREIRERDLVRYWRSSTEPWTHVCALEFSPDGGYIFATLGNFILVLGFRDLLPTRLHYLDVTFDELIHCMLVNFEHHTLFISNNTGFTLLYIGSEGRLYDLLVFNDIGTSARFCFDYDPDSRIFVSGSFRLIEGGTGGISELETWDFWGLMGVDTDTPIHTEIVALGLDLINHIAIHGHSICATLASQELIMYTYHMLTGFAQNVRIPAMDGHELLGCCFPYKNIWWTDTDRHCPVILVYTDIIVLREADNVMFTATVPDHQQVTAYTPDRFGPYLYLGTHSGHIITFSYGQMTFQLRSLTQVTNNTIKYMTDYTTA